jgi:hypothetical protein
MASSATVASFRSAAKATSAFNAASKRRLVLLIRSIPGGNDGTDSTVLFSESASAK